MSDGGSGLGCCLGVVILVVLVLVLGEHVITTTRNFLVYGMGTSNTQAAYLYSQRDNPNFFAEYAESARISVSATASYGVTAWSPWVEVTVTNDSDDPHTVSFSALLVPRINCKDTISWEPTFFKNVPLSSFDVEVPAHSTASGKGFGDPKVYCSSSFPVSVTPPDEPPKITAIDYYPLTGRPQEGHCYGPTCI
jgi:hypothetical protein